MVSTRRTPATATAEPAPARTTRARKAAASQPASGEAEVVVKTTTTTTRTTRRLRSKQNASPLKSLEEPKRNAPKPSAAKATVAKATTTRSKRKRGTPRASLTPESESVKDEDQGIFFTSSMPMFCSTPFSNPLIKPSSSANKGDVSDADLPSSPYVPTWERLLREEQLVPAPIPSPIPEAPVVVALRKENFKLRARVTELEEVNLHLVHQIDALQTGQVQANRKTSDIDSFGIPAEPPSPAQPEFILGDESALALLHKIESAAREPRTAAPDQDSEAEVQSLLQQPEQPVKQSESSQVPANTTPSRPISTPSSFFSRSLTAIKSKLGFTAPTSPAPTPALSTPTSSRAPPPNSFTEVLSTPPTPVGERSKARPKKKKQSPMLRLLIKGVDASERAKAEEWAKHAIATLKNFSDFDAKLQRLETPVLVQDLEHFPSCKPWESGFGDPLGDLDDDEVVPVWAVYLEILAQEEEPKRKRSKSSHATTMDVDFTQSLDEMAAAGIAASEQSAQTPPAKLHDSHGHSASLSDLHPRRSVEPSPMFGSSTSHQQGSNIFHELQGRDTTVELQTNDRETLHDATNKVVSNHNPSQGSFGLDYGSDDEDSTIISETSDVDAGTTPLWTQPPPPAPVPAHAPLPGGAAAEASSVATAQQPVDEVARQRQKLMKHTPAKPSRLREAFVPSPSVRSDAGNESMFLATPLAPHNTFDDMPDAEDLGLTTEDWAAVDAIRNTKEFQDADAAVVWPDAILTYTSDEEDLSPI
jgi:hypothetical protein